MGKGPSDIEKQAMEISSEAGKDLVGLAKDMNKQAAPWRKAAGSAYMTQIKDPWRATSVAQSQLARGTGAALRNVQEAQPGGSRERAERDIMMSQRMGSAQIANAGYNDAVRALGTLGVGQTQAGIGAYGGANQAAGSMAQMGQAQKSGVQGAAQGFGSLLGMI